MRKENVVIIILLLFTVAGSIFFLKRNSSGVINKRNAETTGNYNPTQYAPAELQELLQKQGDKYAVIDTRTQSEYDHGHVPGAVHADYYDLNALKKAAGNKIPVTYDAFSSMRGPYAAYLLYQAGHKNVGIIYGGLTAWGEDIQKFESVEGNTGSVFLHPKNIFPERKKSGYPANQGSVEFNIVAKRFAFAPNQFTVRQGQKVTFHAKSLDVVHGFVLPEYGIEEELLPNQEKDITFIADRKGNFSFITNVVSGRQYASMVGNINVK